MPQPPFPAHIARFLRAPNPCVIASARPDGQPVSVATWYLLEDDGRILVSMDAGRRRLRYLRHDPRVSLTMLGVHDWSAHLSVQGRMTEIDDDDGLTDIDRIATHYTGHAYRNRDRRRVSGWIDIESWHGWQVRE